MDEWSMPAAERAAYANGYRARQAEIDMLAAEVARLGVELERLEARVEVVRERER
jgi:hypothetical protein